MKVVVVTEPTGPWGLQAVVEHYDSTPTLERVVFDRQPRTLSPDRVALASYLLFGHLASGRLQMPQWHTPALAQAIAQDARPAWLQTEPVEFYAKPLPTGRLTVGVEVEGIAGFEPATCPTGAYELRFMRSDRSSGARATFASLELSSNAWLLSVNASQEGRLRVALACAVLFAEDVEADRILIGHGLATKAVLARARRLLDAVRLGLEEA
ncbi:MAG: hypothetical protein ABIO16_11640 [Nocardioides sp.]